MYGRAVMNGISVVVEILFLIAFLFGITFGIVLTASLASRREDKEKSLTSEAPDAACLGTRWLVGAGSRGSGGGLDQ
jgi:hypothetical protein